MPDSDHEEWWSVGGPPVRRQTQADYDPTDLYQTEADYDLTDIYETQIKPLAEQIHDLCLAHDIPMAMAFKVHNLDKPKPIRLYLYNDLKQLGRRLTEVFKWLQIGGN